MTKQKILLLTLIMLFSMTLPLMAAADHVVISEVYFWDSDGISYGFIELYNPTNSPLSLSNLRLSTADSSMDFFGGSFGWPAGTWLQPGEVMVIALQSTSYETRFGEKPDYEIYDSDPAVPDLIRDPLYGQDFFFVQQASDGIGLLDAANGYSPVDAVCWVSSHYGTQPYPTQPGADKALQRVPANQDTDDCSADFYEGNPDPRNVFGPGNIPYRYYILDYGNGPRIVTHPYGLWNSPYTSGVDAFNYNMPQSYTTTSGPHGGYATTTHKCRECHAVHRAAGRFKLLRADERTRSCSWCHELGAGAGYNIQMDNDDALTEEYDVGLTLGFGIQSGTWKAPDDTDPAYTPPYYLGGFSCMDCHSPHANPERIILNIRDHAYPSNPTADRPGRYMLLKNPDVEISGGVEIADTDTTTTVNGYPVNKLVIDWDNPLGANNKDSQQGGGDPDYNNPFDQNIIISEFCTDCHDGNAGMHTRLTRMYAEDRALHGEVDAYDLGYSHDAQPRDFARKKEFNPEDDNLFGPPCRNCHRGGTNCSECHGAGGSIYDPSPIPQNGLSTFLVDGYRERPREVVWPAEWYDSSTTVSPYCADNGFSWPHRTLGYKLLKDELFGLDFDGSPVLPGDTRGTTLSAPASITGQPAHDLDSVCLDCHNPTIWNATSYQDHENDPADPDDDYDDELMLRGLP